MTFGIIGNTYSNAVPDAVLRFLKGIQKHKLRFLIAEDLYAFMRKKNKLILPKALRKSPQNLIRSSNLIISFGGDGTFLSTAKLVGKSGKPIIGINLGKLGFMADVSVANSVEFILDVSKNRYKLDKRTVVEASFTNSSKKLYGLNEIVIGKAGSVKTIQINAYYNNKFVITYLADGLIVSTPTGSTAYSMSAGGPIIDPESSVFILTPICAHTLTARPIVLPDNGKIRIEIESRIPIIATSDGNDKVTLRRRAVVNLKKANYQIKLVKSTDSNYFDVLNKKLLLGQDIRKQLSIKEEWHESM
jgi:NAD+ kinase